MARHGKRIAMVPVDRLTVLNPRARDKRRFRQIVANIEKVGLKPPITVTRIPSDDGLEACGVVCGEGRLKACIALGQTYVAAIVIEASEHDCLVMSLSMLDGICEETVAQLSDKHCPLAVFDVLRKMKPLRQMVAAELMVQHNNYSVAYASAILTGTPEGELVAGAKTKPKGVTPAAMARMERELANLQAAVGSVQESFSKDNLHLTVAKGYLAKLIANPQVSRFLESRYPEFFKQFQAIADVTSTLQSHEAA